MTPERANAHNLVYLLFQAPSYTDGIERDASYAYPANIAYLRRMALQTCWSWRGGSWKGKR